MPDPHDRTDFALWCAIGFLAVALIGAAIAFHIQKVTP